MVNSRFLLIILLISSMSIARNELKASSGSKKQTYIPSFIDYGITIPAPGLSPFIAEPNHPKNSEEALFATYSFSDANTTYNVEFYYRTLYRRARVRVLVGDKELQGLFNRFYFVDPLRSESAYVTRRKESIHLTCLDWGGLDLRETSLNTEVMYDALEAYIGKTVPQKTYFEIRLCSPPGLLEKTCQVQIIEERPPNSAYLEPLSGHYDYLISNDGLIKPLTIENVRKAYHQEGIKAQNTEDYEKICLSMLKAEKKSLIYNRVITDANDIFKRWSKELESETYKKIRPPWLYRDNSTKTDYWNLYVFQKLIPCLSKKNMCYYRYKFGFRNGWIVSAEKTPPIEEKYR